MKPASDAWVFCREFVNLDVVFLLSSSGNCIAWIVIGEEAGFG